MANLFPTKVGPTYQELDHRESWNSKIERENAIQREFFIRKHCLFKSSVVCIALIGLEGVLESKSNLLTWIEGAAAMYSSQ